MTEPTVDFAVGGVEYLGGYTILTEEGGRRFAWSSLTDPKIFPALNFATAETTDDDLIRPVVINGMLWLFKERSAEVWYVDDTSASEAGAFGKMPGGDKEIGLRSFGLITKLPGGAFFVGGDGKAYTLTAGQLQNVGTPGVETAIERSDPDRCFYYEWRGHKFCVIRFRNAPAWVYDLATGEWHERSEGWPVGRWSGVATAKWRGRWMIGSDTGMVSVLHGVVDNLQPLHRIAVSTPVYSDGARSILSEMEFFAHQGLYDTIRERAGLVYAADALFAEDALYAMAEAARNPKLALRLSRDGGMIFGREREEMFGATGRYDKRVVFRALGQFRQMVAEIHMSDPVDIPIFSDARVKFA
ncbi:hypothetical protein [Haematobacter sp. UBA3484]|uniref:hypothetical protein n=1 Tax=Haematobacter sp. UBA3484 TaxID=1946582 RepID=UPI0025C6BE9D|nr:hypothetical protein [Haematobacter sp. UBA3484]